MKPNLFALFICMVLSISCDNKLPVAKSRESGVVESPNRTPVTSQVSREEAIQLSKEAAIRDRGERGLLKWEDYNISATEDMRGWLVRFNPKSLTMKGGGFEYVISKIDSKVVERRFYQ